jgi:putative N6-adenine-specific DNA methylase
MSRHERQKTNRFEYQRTGRYFAQIAPGFEDAATAELTQLGAERIKPGFRGLYFSSRQPIVYRIIYESRLLTRVLAPLDTFRCRDRNDLYRWAMSQGWTSMFQADQSFAIVANVNGNKQLTHSKFAALCLKDGIVDVFRKGTGRRPDINISDPDLLLNLYIDGEKATVSVDASGGSLHRRGYRYQTIAAPMQETLAAAIIALSGWRGDTALIDPMCGSGTLLCEALMAYAGIPAGFLRKTTGLPFLPDYNAGLWREIKETADGRIRPVPAGLISGSDHDDQAVRAASDNCSRLPGGKNIAFECKDYRSLNNMENKLIVCNPPYGIRMGAKQNLDGFYKELGDFLKQRCKGSQAFIYFGNRELIKKIGLKASWKKPLRNAGLDGRLVKYELY